MATLSYPLSLIHRFSTVSPAGSPTTVNLEILSFDQPKQDVDLDLSAQARLIFAYVPMSNILCSTAVLHATSVGPNPMADLDSWLRSSKLMDATLTGDLVLCLLKGTFNDHFHDGEEAATAARRMFQSTGLKIMLVYGVERTEDGDPCDDNIEKFIETIEGAKTLSTSHLSSVVIKITDICSVSLLKRVSDLLRWQYKNPNFKLPWRLNSFPVFSGLSHDATSEPEPLTLEEEQELEKANQRLKSISQKCQESNILLLIEAEDTTLQPAIDYTTSEPEALTVKEEEELEKAPEQMVSSCLPPPPLSPPPLQPSLSSLSLPSPRPPQQLSSSLNQQSNFFFNIAPPHPLNLSNHVPDPHRMDTLSGAALGYCFTACIAFNTIFAQVANPNNVSFRIKLMSQLIYVAFYLLIAANGIFARTHPKLAFYMDRIGSVTVLLASTIAVPTIPVYVSIGLPVFMIIVWAHQHYFHS